MANYDLPTLLSRLEQDFSTTMRMIEKTDDVDADFINPMLRQFLLNDRYAFEKLRAVMALNFQNENLQTESKTPLAAINELYNFYRSHDHDDRYHTKQQVSALLDNKVNLDVVRYQFNFNNNISTLPTFSAQDSLVSSYYKFGRFVNLELKCLKTKAINPQNSFVGIGTLPVGFRPSKEVSGFCIFYEKNGDYYYKKGYGVIAVFKDGQVSLSYVQEGTFGFAGQVSFLS